MSRRRALWIAFGTVAVLLAAAGALVAVLQSRWFYERLRAGIVERVEQATGGRAEIASFAFDWRRMRAEIRGFTLHGTEPAGKPPFLRAQRIAAGLKIVSLLRRDVDIRSLDVAAPRVYVIVDADGRTNVPQPKVRANENAIETILKLAIGQFQVADGLCEVESRGAMPFEARGQNLAAQLRYGHAREPRYEGTVRIRPLEVRVDGGAAEELDVAITAALEKNRVTVSAGRIATGGSAVEFSGAVADWTKPRASFHYDARVALVDVTRHFRVTELRGGEARAAGTFEWASGGVWTASGSVSAREVGYSDSVLTIRNGRLEGAMTAGPAEIDVRGTRISGTYVSAIGQAPADGRITEIAVRPRLLELRGVAVSGLGGVFRGEARLRDWEAYGIEGEISDFAARRVVALYSREPLPWDAEADGKVRVEGVLGRRSELRASAALEITPAPGSAPVRGRITANYDARQSMLDLGHSTLSLPSSRAEFSGAFGKSMRVSLATWDLNDLLPVLGESAASVPVQLRGGAARFEGTVAGRLDAPQFAGRVEVTRFAVDGRPVDSLRANVTASADNVHLRNAVAARGTVTATFDAAVALANWRAGDASAIFGSARIGAAPAADLLALADVANAPLTGSVTAAAQFSGTVGNPLAQGTVEVAKGSYRDEPFDRASAQVSYGGGTLTLRAGQATAGGKQMEFSGSFRHEPGRLDTGHAHVQLATNEMPVENIVTIEKLRPGVKGTLRVSATADLDLTPVLRVTALQADVAAWGIDLAGQRLGDARITATSQGQGLRAHLEGEIAGSKVQGDGTVRLEGEYPASGAVKFSRMDFAQLRPWLPEAAPPFEGFAEGEARIEGSALRLDTMRAELRVPSIEIRPAPAADVPLNMGLRNEGPIVATLAGSTVTVTSARLVGRITDVAITGKVNLQDANPLDMHLAGRFDLAAVHEFNQDFTAAGTITGDAGVKGTFAAPRITGRVQFQNASFNMVDFPNGISNASGVIVFTGDRATIQTFLGETGGGKITLTGFAGYDGRHLVFQLHAQAKEVRVRYPEGVSTVADANLRLTGTSDRSTLAGTITIRRTGFNPQSDFGSVIATSAEPVRTPSARTGLAGGVNFDVQIESAPDIQFQSSLTQDLQVDVNLRLRGSLSNPALIGRVNITQGRVVFYGTKYTIHQGSISFYNPLKIEPVFDIDLETKARGIDITLTISGPLNKLNLTPRSDPPLQFSEIVQLLATGDAPALDPALLGQQYAAPQAWQQAGASALLGQAITSPVAGRLQRFFGVSRLRIDPTLPGIETNNPQARVTMEQQVTPDITFTYITNVTSTNPQVVRMEWAFAKRWSVVALRQENGVLGLDFFYKKRF